MTTGYEDAADLAIEAMPIIVVKVPDEAECVGEVEGADVKRKVEGVAANPADPGITRPSSLLDHSVIELEAYAIRENGKVARNPSGAGCDFKHAGGRLSVDHVTNDPYLCVVQQTHQFAFESLGDILGRDVGTLVGPLDSRFVRDWRVRHVHSSFKIEFERCTSSELTREERPRAPELSRAADRVVDANNSIDVGINGKLITDAAATCLRKTVCQVGIADQGGNGIRQFSR